MGLASHSLCHLAFVLVICGLAESEVFSRGVKSIITHLPNYDKPIPFKMYSGYLKASDKHYVHYWFVESQSAPAFDPVVMWLNGGPGCSSLSGFLEENGPFLLNDNATLRLNEWSWNKEANVLFFESPAGVGFSYSADFEISTNDDQTADHNYNALKDFFFQFPQFAKHDFYITGESYAGVYIPTLAERIIDGQQDTLINLKGIALGNGLLSNAINTDTTVEFAYSHGLVDEQEWATLLKSCCDGKAIECSFSTSTNDLCKYLTDKIVVNTWLGGLNPYDLYRDCWKNPKLGKQSVSTKFIVNVMWMAPASVRRQFIKDGDLGDEQVVVVADPICSNETAATVWLNKPEVRQALHIPSHVGDWTACKAGVKWSYEKQYEDVFPQVRKALANQVKVIVYNGDTDLVCNFLMGQRFSQKVGQALKVSKRQWKYGDGQIGGFVTQYEGGLDFATIKGAGHMAPGWRPEQNWQLLTNWMKGKPY